MRSIVIVLGAVVTVAACTARPPGADRRDADADTIGRVQRDTGAMASSPLLGRWTGSLPAADAAGRRFTLVLMPRAGVELMTEYDGKGSVTEKGAWFADGSALTINLTRRDGQPINSFLAYDVRGDRLVPTPGWDTNLWGTVGPPELVRER